MKQRLSLTLLAMVCVLGFAAIACISEDPPPVAIGDPQAEASALPVVSTTVVLPQTARDGPAGTFHYTVAAGDTLYSLSLRYGTTVAKIVELNGLDNAAAINVGQVLIMPLAPVATATPTRTPTTTPSGPSLVVNNGPRGSGQVALTFDMGGRVEPALDIVNYLIANRIPATIFLTGAMIDNINTDAGRDVLALVEANQELFDFGNHSYSHPNFASPGFTTQQMIGEVTEADAAIARHSGLEARPYFRPPEGGYNSTVLAVLGPLGYTRTIMWDVDTIDWRPESEGGPTAAFMTSKVVNNSQGGSIVLMHLGGYNTFEALPGMIAGLRAKGLEPVKISTMLGE